MERPSHLQAEAAPTETELKLVAKPEDLRHLRRTAHLSHVPAVRRQLTSIYYDTPDLALHGHDLTLRVRKEGRRYIQTLKVDGPFGTASFKRPEWEVQLSGPSPELSRDEMRDHLSGIDVSELQPVFTTIIRRSSRMLQPSPDTAIEVSFDQGTIKTTAGAALPVCEIELELKRGNPQAVFDIARDLTHIRSLRLEPLSKAARGYALIHGADRGNLPTTQRFGRIELLRDMPVEDALTAIVRHSIGHMLVNDRAALEGDAEGVHQMRVALRRLRATLGLFKMLIPPDQRTHAVGELKWLSGILGAARNWDVLEQLVRPIEQSFSAEDDLKALSSRVAQQRRAAYDDVRGALTSSRYADCAFDFIAWAETRAWRHQDVSDISVMLISPLGALADDLLEARYRKARKLGKQFDDLDTGRRHEFRIALKKLRYAADSFEALYGPKPVSRYLERLSALQDELGLLSDIATAERLLHELQQQMPADCGLYRAAGIIEGWTRHLIVEREIKLRKTVSQLLKAKRFWRQSSTMAKPH